MIELPTILMPEADDPTIAKLAMTGQFPPNVLVSPMSLSDAYTMLNSKEVDIVIAGANHTTADVLRTAFKEIGTEDGLASSFFIMERDEQPPIFFADCAVIPDPTAEQLTKIAEQTSRNVKRLGYEAIVAFLSFSTSGSANLEQSRKVKAAYDLFKQDNPNICYGEIQFDAAWNEEIYTKKTGNTFNGKPPNVFIFPDLNSGNIGYKIAESLAGYTAVGTILQGFKRPVYDLSRGITPEALLRLCEVVTNMNVRRKYE